MILVVDDRDAQDAFSLSQKNKNLSFPYSLFLLLYKYFDAAYKFKISRPK